MTEAIAKNAPRQRRAMRGYTLMEFMMALGILALLVSLAVPSIQSGFAKQHLRAATVEVMDVFGYARVQAMARNRAYEVRITGQGSPSGKLAVHESINTRCSGMTGGLQNLKVLDLLIGDYDDIRIVGSEPSGLGAGSFGLCFLPNGRVVQSDTLLPVEATVDGWGAGAAWISIQALKEGSSNTTMGIIHRIIIPYNGVPSMLPGVPGSPHA